MTIVSTQQHIDVKTAKFGPVCLLNTDLTSSVRVVRSTPASTVVFTALDSTRIISKHSHGCDPRRHALHCFLWWAGFARRQVNVQQWIGRGFHQVKRRRDR